MRFIFQKSLETLEKTSQSASTNWPKIWHGFQSFFKYRNGSNFFMSSWDLSQFTLNYPIFSEKSNHPNTHTYAHWCRKRFPVSIRDILYVTHIFSDWLYMYDICNMHVLCTYCIVHSTDSIEKFAICFLHQSVCHNLKLISPPHSSPVIPKILLY